MGISLWLDVFVGWDISHCLFAAHHGCTTPTLHTTLPHTPGLLGVKTTSLACTVHSVVWCLICLTFMTVSFSHLTPDFSLSIIAWQHPSHLPILPGAFIDFTTLPLHICTAPTHVYSSCLLLPYRPFVDSLLTLWLSFLFLLPCSLLCG